MFGNVIERFLAYAVEGDLYFGGKDDLLRTVTTTGISIRPESAFPNRCSRSPSSESVKVEGRSSASRARISACAPRVNLRKSSRDRAYLILVLFP